MPILVGAVALLLLALLSVGVWLIMKAARENPPAPAAPTTAPAAPAPVATEPTTEPTTGPPTATPTTTAPEPSPGPTQPRDVRVPALVGLSSAEARQALDRVGLTYRLIHRPAEAAAGTVVDSDPPEGREVPADTQVTLIVATAGAPEAPGSAPAGGGGVPAEGGVDEN